MKWKETRKKERLNEWICEWLTEWLNLWNNANDLRHGCTLPAVNRRRDDAIVAQQWENKIRPSAIGSIGSVTSEYVFSTPQVTILYQLASSMLTAESWERWLQHVGPYHQPSWCWHLYGNHKYNHTLSGGQKIIIWNLIVGLLYFSRISIWDPLKFLKPYTMHKWLYMYI